MNLGSLHACPHLARATLSTGVVRRRMRLRRRRRAEVHPEEIWYAFYTGATGAAGGCRPGRDPWVARPRSRRWLRTGATSTPASGAPLLSRASWACARTGPSASFRSMSYGSCRTRNRPVIHNGFGAHKMGAVSEWVSVPHGWVPGQSATTAPAGLAPGSSAARQLPTTSPRTYLRSG